MKSARQASEDDGIVVTPAMEKAGSIALMGFDPESEFLAERAIEIYTAMVRASRADADELEVTPEMCERGLMVLYEHGVRDAYDDEIKAALAEAFRAMCAMQRRKAFVR